MAKRTIKNQQEQVAAQIRLDVKSDTPSYYVNYIGVTHTAYDFTLSMVKMPSPPSDEQIELVKSGKPMLLEPILQVVLPPLLMDGLIKALIDQKQRYEQTLQQQVKSNEHDQHIKSSGTVN